MPDQKQTSVGSDWRQNKKTVPVPTDHELEAFYKSINESDSKPAILKITDPYHEAFIPKLSRPMFPQPLSELYNPDTLQLNYTELLKECERVFVNLKV